VKLREYFSSLKTLFLSIAVISLVLGVGAIVVVFAVVFLRSVLIAVLLAFILVLPLSITALYYLEKIVGRVEEE